jgi:hypothetical protein
MESIISTAEVDPVFLDTKLGENQSSRRAGGWHQSGIVAKWRGR